MSAIVEKQRFKGEPFFWGCWSASTDVTVLVVPFQLIHSVQHICDITGYHALTWVTEETSIHAFEGKWTVVMYVRSGCTYPIASVIFQFLCSSPHWEHLHESG